jgi:predicted metal-dependent peptidase
MVDLAPGIDQEVMDEADRIVRRAKLQLWGDNDLYFYSSLLANLTTILTTQILTAATNGIFLKLNPLWILEMTAPQLFGLILHEVMHVVLEHTLRRLSAGLDPQIYNIAGDHYINLYIRRIGYEIPDGGCCDPQYTGMSTRQIYDELIQDPPPDAEDFDMDIVFVGGDDGSDDAQSDQDVEQVITNILKAANQAEMAGYPGSIPDDIGRRLEEIKNPQLPWHVLLQNHVSPHAKDDYSYRRPNRRYMPEFYMPEMKSDALNQITAASDVSGSMLDEWLNKYACEIQYVWDVLQPISLRYMTFDTEVHMDKLYHKGDTFDSLEIMGGGGTDVTPIIEGIREDCPAIAIIFTDGDFYMPDLSDLTTDLIWIIIDDPSWTAPYGTVIHFES